MKKKLIPSLISVLTAATLWLSPTWARLEDNLNFTPPQADAFLALSVDAQDWQYFLERKPFSELFATVLADLVSEPSQELGLDPEHFLKSLLGSHISVAVYHNTQASETNLPLLVAIDIKDPSLFAQAIAKIKQMASEKKEAHLLEIPTEGTTLYGFSKTPDPKDAAFFMTLSHHTLLLGSLTLLEKALAAAKSGQNLAQDPHFANTLKSLGKEKLWVYLRPDRLGNYFKMVPKAASQGDQEILTQMQQSLKLYDSLGFGIDLNARGLRFKSFMTLAQKDTPERKYLHLLERAIRQPQAPLRELLKAAPERPLLFMAGQGLHLMPMGMKAFSHTQPEVKKILETVFYKGFREFTHLDMERDILTHSDGRAGVSVFYPETIKTIDQPPYMVIYLGVKNNAQFLKNLQSKLLLDLSVFEVEQNQRRKKNKKKQDMTITFPKTPQARYRGAPLYMSNLTPAAQTLKREMDIQPGYTHVGNLWFFGSNLEALKASIDYALRQDASLTDNHYFTALREKYGMQEDAGLFFVDLGRVVHLVKLFMGEDEEVQALLPTLQAFKSLTAGGSYRDNGVEGIFLVDVDMNQIDFELLAQLIGEFTATPQAEQPEDTENEQKEDAGTP